MLVVVDCHVVHEHSLNNALKPTILWCMIYPHCAVYVVCTTFDMTKGEHLHVTRGLCVEEDNSICLCGSLFLGLGHHHIFGWRTS